MKYRVKVIKMLTKLGVKDFGDVLEAENLFDVNDSLKREYVEEVNDDVDVEATANTAGSETESDSEKEETKPAKDFKNLTDKK